MAEAISESPPRRVAVDQLSYHYATLRRQREAVRVSRLAAASPLLLRTLLERGAVTRQRRSSSLTHESPIPGNFCCFPGWTSMSDGGLRGARGHEPVAFRASHRGGELGGALWRADGFEQAPRLAQLSRAADLVAAGAR
jgi:hypothetical protein